MVRSVAILLLLCLGVVASSAQETVYKRVDEYGTVEFSDNEVPGAEEVVIEEPQVIQPAPPLRLPRLRSNSPNPLGDLQYTVQIDQPGNDQVLTDGTGNLSVAISINRQLFPEHRLQVSMDGQVVGETTGFTLSNIDRGTHVLLARVVDAQGSELAVSSPVTFHVRRPVIRPAPARKPN